MAENLLKPVDNGILAFQVQKPAITNGRCVRKGSDTDISIPLHDHFPGKSGQAVMQFLWSICLHCMKKIENPMTGPDIQVECHGIRQGSFRFNGRFRCVQDWKAQSNDLRLQVRSDSLGAGYEYFTLPQPRRHGFYLTQVAKNG